MAEDTFWSDTLNVVLSESVESSIESSEPVIIALAKHLSGLGHKITRIDESHPGTKNLHPRREMFLDCGGNAKVISQVEAFLSSHGVRFAKHEDINDEDHIDIGYDLNNVSLRIDGK